MHKFWVVARHEYLFHLRRRGFLVSTFVMPFVLMLLFVVIITVVYTSSTINAIGYVDNSNLFHRIAPDVTLEGISNDVQMVRYTTLEQAQTDLRQDKVQAIFVVPADYLNNGKVTAYAMEALPTLASSTFEVFMKRVVAVQLLDEPSQRVLEPVVKLDSVILDAPPEEARRSLVTSILPIMFGVIFLGSTFAGGSYLMLALLEEKEQRIMEILASSVSTYQLMAGKIVGLGALALTQLLVWTSGGICLLLWGATQTNLIGDGGISPRIIILMIALFFPAYFLVAATLSAIGAAVQSPQQGQQLTGVVTLLSTVPLGFLSIMRDKPNGVAAIVLNIFPYSAPITLMQRTITSVVPVWQQVATVVWLWLWAGLMMVLAGKIVRLGLLRYNAAVRFREIWYSIRSKSSR